MKTKKNSGRVSNTTVLVMVALFAGAFLVSKALAAGMAMGLLAVLVCKWTSRTNAANKRARCDGYAVGAETQAAAAPVPTKSEVAGCWMVLF